MKEIVKYQAFTIPSPNPKLRCDVRLTIDDTKLVEYHSTFEGTSTTIITLYPFVMLSIVRPMNVDDNGNKVKAAWNQNDSIILTKYTYPIFLTELMGIQKDMKIQDLYTYHGKRLELNEEIAAKIRRPFMVGNSTTVELSAVIITQPDDTRVEGIKIKFNNEQSSVSLTLNELNSLCFNLEHLNIDMIGISMYNNYVKKGIKTMNSTNMAPAAPKVDILPKDINDFI